MIGYDIGKVIDVIKQCVFERESKFVFAHVCVYVFVYVLCLFMCVCLCMCVWSVKCKWWQSEVKLRLQNKFLQTKAHCYAQGQPVPLSLLVGISFGISKQDKRNGFRMFGLWMHSSPFLVTYWWHVCGTLPGCEFSSAMRGKLNFVWTFQTLRSGNCVTSRGGF